MIVYYIVYVLSKFWGVLFGILPVGQVLPFGLDSVLVNAVGQFTAVMYYAFPFMWYVWQLAVLAVVIEFMFTVINFVIRIWTLIKW